MSDKELSSETVNKDYDKVLKKTEHTIKDIDHVLAAIKEAEHGIHELADTLDITMERFDQLDLKTFHKARIPKSQKDDAIKVVQDILDENLNAKLKASKPKKKVATCCKKIRKKGLRI